RGDGAGLRWGAAQHGDRQCEGPGADGLGDALRLRRRPPGVPRRPHPEEALRYRQQPDRGYDSRDQVRRQPMSAAEVLTPVPKLVRDDLDNGDNYEIIDGQRVELPPMSADSQALASRLVRHLSNHGITENFGEAYTEILFKLPLPKDRNRKPDAAFVPY